MKYQRQTATTHHNDQDAKHQAFVARWTAAHEAHKVANAEHKRASAAYGEAKNDDRRLFEALTATVALYKAHAQEQAIITTWLSVCPACGAKLHPLEELPPPEVILASLGGADV
jgi:hypothetical protein